MLRVTIGSINSYAIKSISVSCSICCDDTFFEFINPDTKFLAFEKLSLYLFHFDFSNQLQTVALLKNFGLAGGFIFIAVNGPKDFAFDKKAKYVRL